MSTREMSERTGLWTLAETAVYLQIPERTLYAWRYKHTGPTAIRVGRFLRYRPSDVESWLDEQQAEAA